MSKKVYDISSGSWEEVNEIRSLPLSYEQIIGKCVVGLVCYVTTPAGYQTAYTNAESKKLKNTFNMNSNSMLVDMIKYWPIEVNNKLYIWMRYGFNDVNIWGSDICLIKI